MSCEYQKKYELGKIEDEEFKKHLKICSSCQKTAELDKQLMALARSIKQQVKAPLLWKRIEKSLREEQKRLKQDEKIKCISWKKLSLIPTAAILLLALSAGVYFLLIHPGARQSNLLTQSALKKVERKEAEYIRAIEKLEERVQAKLSTMDTELMLLYRDRLETIDEQIMRCQEALAQNPSNAHIRRYLLAALIDKKETLKEILSFQPQSEEK